MPQKKIILNATTENIRLHNADKEDKTGASKTNTEDNEDKRVDKEKVVCYTYGVNY